MRKLLCCMLLGLCSSNVMGADEGPNQRLLMLDEDVWVAFYDLPSRRFRSIRDAFLQRNFEAVARDLEITVSFLRVESGRAVVELQPYLEDVTDNLEAIRVRVADPSVTVSSLDALFARAHWLLSQHYLVLALDARAAGLHRNAGRYLIATAHHLERAVLWSDARITRELVGSLDSIRAMAGKLERGENSEKVYRDRPLRLTARTLVKVGEHIDRIVRIEELLPE